MRKDGFVLREFHGIRFYSCKALEQIAHLHHGFSTRVGGLPGPGESLLNLGYSSRDSDERVNENRRRFLSALNLGDSSLITLHQVHSNRVIIIEDNRAEWNQSEADALITGVENVALAVKTADCLPVLIADPVKRAVGAVHSGWKGTLSRILLQTILEMKRTFDSDPQHLLVAVGPGIRPCCFEVGSDVAALFEKEYPDASLAAPIMDRHGKYFVDLCKALEIQLDLAGVPVLNRYDSGACTCCRTGEFFSYRAEGAASGRMMAVIGLTRSARRAPG